MQKIDKIVSNVFNLVSIVFNPLIIPTLGSVMVFRSGNYFLLWPFNVVIWIIFFVSLGTLLLPLVILRLMQYFQYISDLQLPGHGERIVPYALILIPYFLTYVLLQQINVPSVVQGIIFSACIGIVVNLFFLFFWKISSHAIGAGGLMSLVLMLFLQWQSTNFALLYLAILVCGLVCSARLWLGVHTEAQVYAGAFVGFVITTVVLMAS